MSLTRTPTAMRSSSETSLQRLINELRYDQRLPAQIECSYANELCQNIEEQANEEEDCAERDRLLEFAGTSRKVLGIALSRKDGSSRSSMFLDGDNKVEGKQLVLRDGKQSVHSSPGSSLSEKRQCQPVHPTPVHSARVDQDDGTQCDFDRPPSMARSNDVPNPTNGQGRSQILEDPSATNFLTNSAPIFNQNVNSGSGQQNIEVNGDFEVPPSYTPTAAPREYEAPFVFERNELRGSGLQRADASRDIINQTAGNDRRGGYSQTLKGPHGRTHLRTMAPVYNQNINSGDGQQNIDVKGRMGFQKQSFKEPSRQGPEARHSSQTSAQVNPLPVEYKPGKTRDSTAVNLDRPHRLDIVHARLLGSICVVGVALWHPGRTLRIGMTAIVITTVKIVTATFVRVAVDPARLLGWLRTAEVDLWYRGHLLPVVTTPGVTMNTMKGTVPGATATTAVGTNLGATTATRIGTALGVTTITIGTAAAARYMITIHMERTTAQTMARKTLRTTDNFRRVLTLRTKFTRTETRYVVVDKSDAVGLITTWRY